MIKTKQQIEIKEVANEQGGKLMSLAGLKDFEGVNPKLNMYSRVTLYPGQEVGYHLHDGNSEIYYILSGKGVYDDNGEKIDVEEGTVTFTPSGSSHGLKNTGDDVLEFIALIVLD